MKIGIQTWGTYGDIRPFLALAEGLQAAGNEVHLVITCVDSSMDQSMESENGVRISVVASPILDQAQQEEAARETYSIRNPVRQTAALLRLCFSPAEAAMFNAAQRLCAESDIVIGHFMMYPLQAAAESARRPYVSVLLSHAAIPSEFTHPFGPFYLGRSAHRLIWSLIRNVLNRALLHGPNRLRAQLGLAPASDLVKDVWLSEQLTLVAVSPQICTRQIDWPPAVQVCGYLDKLLPRTDGCLPHALSTFLNAGTPPVYMTFGSWMPLDIPGQTRALHLLTQAARKANCRAIIQSRSAPECGFSSDEQILYVTSAPHQMIFPFCSAVVHHGGAGTTHAATLAGKASIVIANISEQEHWASELCRLGIASKAARRRTVSAAGIARRIRQVLASPEMVAKAESIAGAMRNERGVERSVELIMQKFDGLTHPPRARDQRTLQCEETIRDS